MPKISAYPPLDGLLDLACRDGVDVRPTLLRVLTDLYLQKPTHSAVEETQYVELALGLIDTVDEQTRATVAARLSTYPAAPKPILRKLNVQTATPVPQAAPAPRSDLAALFFMAGTDERRLILANLDAGAQQATQPPAPASHEMIRRLETAALSGNQAEFTHLLERALSINHDMAARIVRDRSGEPVVIAAKALGMKAAVLQRILLFLNPVIGQSVERVYALADLFDEVTLGTATHMLSIWRASGTRARPAYAPQFHDDEKRTARSPAGSTRQPSAPLRDIMTSRSRSAKS